jgi:Ca-activated chloride channel family protein
MIASAMHSGLYCTRPHQTASSPSPIPLCGVTVEARIDGAASEVILRQRYRNTEATPIEAVYIFPLPTNAAVCGFVAELDGRRITGQVEEREKAFERYDDALAEGHGAFLLDQERPNIFTMSVGNLLPQTEAIIELRWVATLPAEGPAYRFQLPTTVAPRYTPPSERPEVGQPDSDRINPERLAHVPYGLELAIDVALGRGMPKRVESPTHAIRTTYGESLRVELGQAATAMDRDFVLIIEPPAAMPAARVTRGPDGARYVQVDFIPELTDDGRGVEVVFVVDCSGSMSGDSIDEARRALELCVRALDTRDRFDIVRFGSTHEALFGEARPFGEATLEQALAFIAATDANLGGTEILEPLKSICARRTEGRNILLLTDGQVSNESEVIALAEREAARNRIFAFGIGHGVSEHLVREVARASRGECELIAPGERIESKVLRQFGRLRTPRLDKIAIDWGLEVEAAPREIPAVFGGDPVVAWAKVLSGDTRTITLRAGDRRWTVPVDLERPVAPAAVATLWARAAIAELERAEGRHGSSQKRSRSQDGKTGKLVALGKDFGLMSSVTSYVAVDTRSGDARRFGPLALREVPVADVAGPPTTLNAALGMKRRSRPDAKPDVMERIGSFAASFSLDEVARHSLPPAFHSSRSSDVFAPSMASSLARLLAPGARSNRFGGAAADVRSDASDPGLDLFALLLTQGADGAFAPSEVLARVVHRDVWDREVAQRGTDLVATIAALFLLETRYADRRDEWRAAASKAQRFLAGQAMDLWASFDAATLF